MVENKKENSKKKVTKNAVAKEEKTVVDNIVKTKEENKETVEVKKEKKKVVKKISAKELAIVNGIGLKISAKHCFSICKLLKRKTPSQAISRLEDVIEMRRAVPMANREVPHQKGKGMAGGRFPKNACIEIIKLLNQLKANAVVNSIEDPVIVLAKANKAKRPFKKAGRKAKRAHVYIEVRSKSKLKMEKKK